MARDEAVPSWNDGPTKDAILEFVGSLTTERSPEFVPAKERIAVFDNDGTLWTEKPMPIQLDFLVRRFAEQAGKDASLRTTQPYKAGCEKDLKWMGEAVSKHYNGDDSDLKLLMKAVNDAYATKSIEEHRETVDISMLQFVRARSGEPLRMLILHDDAEREFDYTDGADRAIAMAKKDDWTIVSIMNDWKRVFADQEQTRTAEAAA